MAKIVKKKISKVIKKLKKAPIKKKLAMPVKVVMKKPLSKKKVIAKKLILRKRKVKILSKTETPFKLKKASHNPIISPSLYPWESQATFNPTAFVANNKVHIVYRAIGGDDSSALGYASTYDGLNISDRPTYSIYKRYFEAVKSAPHIGYISGGGWSGGCEDPRITLMEGMIHMLYTAFDGWGSVRIALTSIPLSDFQKKKWNWSPEVFISAPGEVQKNWVIFPEKINGKVAILHAISPEIMIDYVHSLDEFDGKKFIKSIHQNHPKWQFRERGIRGVGPAPIKTKLGWLVLYHKIEDSEPNRYKLFAMILDINDPTKVLYRMTRPILEPEEHYENHGHKWGVIYACGAVVKPTDYGSKENTLFVYYGGSDKFVCVASMPLEELLNDIVKGLPAKLKKSKME